MNAVNWFELPVLDMPRAVAFYEEVFQVKLSRLPSPDLELMAFPMEDGAPGSPGALAKGANYSPSATGANLYFECVDVAVELSRVEAAGGKVLTPKIDIGEFGFVAIFVDSEGNRVGLHSEE